MNNSKTMILCSNPLAQYLSHKDEIDCAIQRVLSSGRYILGEEVLRFEEEFSAYLGTSYAIGVANGTEALALALKAFKIGASDEVITTSLTAFATVSAIEQVGAKAVLVDIDPQFFTIDPAQVEKAITSKTKAILPVHLYGQPADMAAIVHLARKHHLRVIEDCAQAIGTKINGQAAGTLGDVGCFSFYPTKNLGAIGDAGMIVTNDPGIAESCRVLREYGWDHNRVSQRPGYNSRLDEIQAAILRVKLKYLDHDNQKRRDIAGIYNEQLSALQVELPQARPECRHAYHLYAIRSDRREELKNYLYDQGIQALVHYQQAIHQHPGHRAYFRVEGSMTNTEQIVGEVLSLPIYPQIPSGDIKKIIESIQEFCEQHSALKI